MRQIEKIDLNIGQAYLSEWNDSMAIRELIANAIDETNDGKIEIKRLSKDKWSITNVGNEIKPENFVINEGDKYKQKGKIGEFGIGLKDAIAVLMIRGIEVTILTSQYKYVP